MLNFIKYNMFMLLFLVYVDLVIKDKLLDVVVCVFVVSYFISGVRRNILFLNCNFFLG